MSLKKLVSWLLWAVDWCDPADNMMWHRCLQGGTGGSSKLASCFLSDLDPRGTRSGVTPVFGQDGVKCAVMCIGSARYFCNYFLAFYFSCHKQILIKKKDNFRDDCALDSETSSHWITV